MPLHPIAYDVAFDPAYIEMAADHMRHSATLGLPELEVGRSLQDKCLIVGSSPSLPFQLGDIIKLKSEGAKIFAINDSIRYLLDNLVVPDYTVIFEISDQPGSVIRSLHPDITYYVSSMCHPSTFEALKDNKVIVFHLDSDQEQHNALISLFKTPFAIGGGAFTFTRTLPLSIAIGFRDFEIFGVDCSFEKDSHFFGDVNVQKTDIFVAKTTLGEQKAFKTKPYLVRQADEFKGICLNYHQMFKMKVHGEGMLARLHRRMWPQMYLDETGANQ